MAQKRHPQIHMHACEICKQEYPTVNSINWSVCHNCKEHARLFVREQAYINQAYLDDFTEFDFVIMLFEHFNKLYEINISAYMKNCLDQIQEIINNNVDLKEE